MVKHADLTAITGEEEQVPKGPKRKRHWAIRLLFVVAVLTLIVFTFRLLIGRLYQGPRDVTGVVMVMPGVPIFPLSQISPRNLSVQRAMALPLWFMRYQGAARAETAQLQAPADDFFIVAWYRRIAPSQGWAYIGQQTTGSGTRVIFTRRHEGLQLTIGITRDLYTPYQLLYLQGMTDRQLQQFIAAVPRDVTPATDITPAPTLEPSTTAPALAPEQPSAPGAEMQPPTPTGPSPLPTSIKPARKHRNNRLNTSNSRPPRQRALKVQPKKTVTPPPQNTVPSNTKPAYTKPIYPKSEQKNGTKSNPTAHQAL